MDNEQTISYEGFLRFSKGILSSQEQNCSVSQTI